MSQSSKNDPDKPVEPELNADGAALEDDAGSKVEETSDAEIDGAPVDEAESAETTEDVDALSDDLDPLDGTDAEGIVAADDEPGAPGDDEPAAEEPDPVDDPADDGHAEVHHDEHQGSSIAATALKALITVIVVFALAIWLLPLAAPYLPGPISRHLMPGQRLIDDRLAAFEDRLAQQTDQSGGRIEALQAEIAALEAKLAATETEAQAARSSAQVAMSTATETARTAGESGVSEDVLQQAESAARVAAASADTATSAATEAAQVASAATRDAAEVARQMEVFEARLNTISSELGALSEGFAAASREEGGTTTPELSAAFSALKARVDGIVNEVATAGAFITKEDIRTFATQEDLRISRKAMAADMTAALAAYPPAASVATEAAVGALREDLQGKLSANAGRIDALGGDLAKTSKSAAEAVAAASAASETVQIAISQASLRSAIAAMTSRLVHGVAYATALAEIERISGTPAPDALATHAGTGVATEDDLQRGFGRAAQNALTAELEANSDGGVLGRATARVTSIVSGRPKSAQEGDDAASTLSRVEAELRTGALAQALAEASTLSDAAQSGLAGWLDQLRGRVAAEEEAAAYAASVTGSEG